MTRSLLLSVLAVVCLGGSTSSADDADGLRLHWEKRFLEIRCSMIPGGPIRTHYLEAYCRPGSTDRDWKETVIPHKSELVYASPDGKRIEILSRFKNDFP